MTEPYDQDKAGILRLVEPQYEAEVTLDLSRHEVGVMLGALGQEYECHQASQAAVASILDQLVPQLPPEWEYQHEAEED